MLVLIDANIYKQRFVHALYCNLYNHSHGRDCPCTTESAGVDPLLGN